MCDFYYNSEKLYSWELNPRAKKKSKPKTDLLGKINLTYKTWLKKFILGHTVEVKFPYIMLCSKREQICQVENCMDKFVNICTNGTKYVKLNELYNLLKILQKKNNIVVICIFAINLHMSI